MDGERYVYRNSSLVAVRRTEPAVTFCLAEPFDQICRRLSTGYLEGCWQNLGGVLADFDLDATQCEWGTGHPGVMTTPTETWEDHPLTGTGWWFPESSAAATYDDRPTPTSWLSIWNEIDASLRQTEPPLMVAQHGYRSHVLRGINDEVLDVADGAVGIAFLQSDALDDATNWRGRSDAGDGPWATLSTALLSNDRSAFDCGIRDALEEYTPPAAHIVVRGFANFAFSWIDADAPWRQRAEQGAHGN